MSKQLTLSAIAAILTMGLFALSVEAGHFDPAADGKLAGKAPLPEMSTHQ